MVHYGEPGAGWRSPSSAIRYSSSLSGATQRQAFKATACNPGFQTASTRSALPTSKASSRELARCTGSVPQSPCWWASCPMCARSPTQLDRPSRGPAALLCLLGRSEGILVKIVVPVRDGKSWGDRTTWPGPGPGPAGGDRPAPSRRPSDDALRGEPVEYLEYLGTLLRTLRTRISYPVGGGLDRLAVTHRCRALPPHSGPSGPAAIRRSWKPYRLAASNSSISGRPTRPGPRLPRSYRTLGRCARTSQATPSAGSRSRAAMLPVPSSQSADMPRSAITTFPGGQKPINHQQTDRSCTRITPRPPIAAIPR